MLEWISFAFKTLVLLLIIRFVKSIYDVISQAETPPKLSETRFIPKGKIKKVAVIGAGSSGITAAKEAIQAGFDVTVFEQTGEIGGNWYYREKENHSSIYRSTFINTSKQVMTYSDFPMPDEYPTYPHHKQIIKYFYDYARHFKVTDHIKFNTQVLSIVPEGDLNPSKMDQKWKVTYVTGADGTPLYMKNSQQQTEASNSVTETFDAVMVCNGHHSVPRWPTPSFPGIETFPGHLIHSHSYKDPTTGYNFHDKKVVVVGIGNSSVDIANELSRCSEQVYLSTRTGAWVLPKYLFGRPLDHSNMTRLLSYIPDYILLPVVFKPLQWLVTLYQGPMSKWGLDPKCNISEAHPTISHELLHRIGNGTILVKPNIKRIEGSTVIFDNDTRVEADAIIVATGYHIKFHFIDEKILKVTENNEVNLYKYIFSPALPPTLSIIGLVQPLGAIMPIAEIQSRWIVQLLLGNVALPTKEEMEADIAYKKRLISKRYLSRSRHTIQVDGSVYMDEIASLFGALPSLKGHWRIWKQWFFSPIIPFQYRLDGPSKWDGAEDAILKAFET